MFCIIELLDLAPRIQVALFNILEEQDVQVRGIPLRLPLDLLLIFTANPEDYTSRGQIITPLKDRIGAQIFTHYPKQRQHGVDIIEQEAEQLGDASCQPQVSGLFANLIEEVARAARVSEYVDQVPSFGAADHQRLRGPAGQRLAARPAAWRPAAAGTTWSTCLLSCRH